MLIQVGYAWARVKDASPEELDFLRTYLTFTSRRHTGEGTSASLLTPDGLFPAGLSDMVVRTLRERGTPAQRILRALPGVIVPPEKVDLSVCWPHQRDAIMEVLQGRYRGVIQHATGTGKGTTISVLCKHIIGRVLVVVPSKQLLIEMCDRLAKHGIKAGRVGDGRRDLGPRVVVCIAASLKTLKKHDLEGFVAVLVDEAHGVPSPTILEPLMRCVNAAIRLGFSGTPMERADKKSLYIVGVLGEVIHRFTPAKAVDRGIVARCRLRMVPLQHPCHPANGRYDQWERRAIVRNRARNLLLARLVSNSESPRIVFVRTKEHQAVLAKLLGVDCLTVNDETPSKQVKSILEAFKAGSVGTLISTPIFRQGVDIPEVNTVINGAGGKATIDVIQKVGRGSRRFQADGSTKDEFRVYDIDDRGCGCGGAHKSCIWLERHSEGRNAAYLKFGYAALSED